MSSVTAICNVALSNIGKPSILDMNEASEEARQCTIHYAITRDTMLQGYPWLFARRTMILAELANPLEERWGYAYMRPTDCLKPIRIVPSVDIPSSIHDIPYGVGDGLIFCDVSPAKLEYTGRLEDPSRFSPLFQDALSWALATKLALPLTRDQSIRKDAFQIANQTIGAAQMADANEERGSSDFPSSIIEARN